MMRTVRRLTTTSVVGGVVAAALVAVSPTTAAAPNTTPVTQNINHGYTCQGIEWESIATFPTTPTYNDGQPVAGMINTTAGRQTTVTYPREIAPGGQFSVYVQSGTWTASGEEMGRAKFDIALPANATVRGVANVGGGSGWTSGNPQPRVERVGSDGNPNASGQFVRIWGGASVNNGGNEDTNTPKGGVYSVRNGTFRFPRVRIDLTAPTTAGEQIAVGLRGAGAGPERNGVNNALSFALDKRDGIGGFDNFNNDDYWCTTPANTSSLTSTRVIGTPVTQLTTTNLEIETGTVDTELTARVTSNAAQPSPIDEGEVEFFVNGVSIGRQPVQDGVATTTHTFPPLDDREPVTYDVTARYLGVTNKFEQSEDSATTATVNPGPKAEVTSTVALTAERGRVEDGRLPVELAMEIETSDGLDLPAGSQVEIRRDGEVIATVPVDGITASYTDSVPTDVDEDVTYTYTATLLENETYDTIYQASEPSNEVEITVAPEYTPDLTVAAEPATLLVGRTADLSATLTHDGEALPAGTEVTFRVNGRDVGTATTDAAGTAVLTGHEFRTAGEKTIVAHFDGATVRGVTYLPVTSAPTTVTVQPLPGVDTRTVIDVTTEVTAGDEVTMTAHVSRADGTPLTADEAAERGSVWFFDGADAIGSAPVTIDPAAGEARAVFVHRFAETGEHRITAEYSGTRTADEVLAPSETDEATVVTVTPTEVVIDDPRPPTPPATGGGGSLDLGSLLGETGGGGTGGGSLGSLTGSAGS